MKREIPSKLCAKCGVTFFKLPRHSAKTWETEVKYCQRACKTAAQTGAPSKKRGRKYPGNPARIPCRICGQPTPYFGTEKNKLWERVHCGAEACRQASLAIRNKRVSASKLASYRTGKTKRCRTTWNAVARVSPDEVRLREHLYPLGWVQQFKFVTGVTASSGMPRCFWLDFALVDKKLCIEIDGSSHRLWPERYQRRDAMLAERGWKTLRLASDEVNGDRQSMLEKIAIFSQSIELSN